MAFLFADGNLPFTIALALMLGIALTELGALLLGGGLSQSLDDLLPAEVTAETPGVESGPLSRLLSWLRFGQVPALMLLVVFLTAFGLIGLAVQMLAGSMLSVLLPGGFAAVPAFALALPVVRIAGGVLARVMPRDETESVAEASFVGRVAVITLGQARHGHAAQARLRDQHGHAHYVMVEPDDPAGTFAQGDQVLLVRREGALFRAIPNTSAALVD
jgi:hypothetical protein